MWLRHWNLERDPFLGNRPPYVSLPSHDEAVSRLVYSIERGHRLTSFFAEAGLGKTTVVRKALVEARHPRRRFVLVHAPSDGQQLLAMLADGLGTGCGMGSQYHDAWKRLARTVRSATLEGSQVIFVIDGWDEATDPAMLRDLNSLLEVECRGGRLTMVIRVGRGPSDSKPGAFESWTLAIGLDRLTRSQVETYLKAKLEAAGCGEPLFTPHAVTRLHAWSGGLPRGVDQLAPLALMAAAMQGLEVVSPDVVDGVASQGLEGVNIASVAR